MKEEIASPVGFVESVTAGENLAEMLPEDALKKIGREAVRDYKDDKSSMKGWLDRMKSGIDLAKLVKADKSYPFDKAANIKYPLVTTAAMQFNARAYPAIVPSDTPVKCKTYGADPDGAKQDRADRVGSYMSWQVLSEIEEWDQDTDRLLLQLPVVGDMFRKVWFNGERAETRLVEPGKLIVNAASKSLAAAPRVSEEFSLYPYEVQERERGGMFAVIEYDNEDEDDQKPLEFIEQHCRLDLDDDGYPEPYVVTVYPDREKVVRIVADFTAGDVIYETQPEVQRAIVQTDMGMVEVPQVAQVPIGIKKIKRNSYFVHYQFLPGFDDGLFGIGLGMILGDISEGINSTFNMLLDSGHYASLGGGFIGSDFRIKGGAQRMRPGEWRQVSAKGGDIKNAMVPATFPGPDATLFQMLGLLIEMGKEVASVKDVMTGETATNMQPTTVMALIEQGLKVFTASYKRIYRGLKREFATIARINAETLDPEKYQAFHDMPVDPREDFALAGMDVEPVADPQSVTKMQEMAKAQLLMDLAGQGLVNPQEAVRRILEAASIGEIEALAPEPDPVQAQMQAQIQDMQLQAAMADLAQKRADLEMTAAKIEAERVSAMKDLSDMEAQDKRLQLDALKAMLEGIGRDMDRAIAGGRSGMAGAPGNAGPSGGYAGAIGG